ncbi:MAG TPA: hypothetical protein VHG93_22240, partial [Longimicrobium sp.]|nr:hypothetical protein [Longimicrobium sp.]
IHAPDGRLLALVGRPGTGPGEFRHPRSAAVVPDGSFEVVDTRTRRLTRFGPDGALDTVIAFPEAMPTHLDYTGGRAVLGLRRPAGAEFGFLGRDGGFTPFHSWDPVLLANRYWRNVAVDHVAGTVDGLLVAGSMQYPLWRYSADGAKRTPLGTPPPSWHEPTPMRPGPADLRTTARWLRSFTVIAGVHALADGTVVVAHGRYNPRSDRRMTEIFRIHPYAVDVYGPGGRKLAEDVALPGPVLYADSLLYLQTAQPPDAWTVSRYRLRPAALRTQAKR